MEKTGEIISTFLVGCICGVFCMILADQYYPQKIFKTKQKATIDYELEAKGKVIDTIWVYKIK